MCVCLRARVRAGELAHLPSTSEARGMEWGAAPEGLGWGPAAGARIPEAGRAQAGPATCRREQPLRWPRGSTGEGAAGPARRTRDTGTDGRLP